MHQYVYLNAQRFGLFLHDFELFTDEERMLCIKRIREKYPEQVLMLLDYFVADIVNLPDYIRFKYEKGSS